MKRLAVLSLTVGLFGVPIQAQAQQYRSSTPALVQVLFRGDPALAQTDCDLGAGLFAAAVVMGVDMVSVTPEMRQIWRDHMVAAYPTLAPADQYALAHACEIFVNLTSTWPQMHPVARERQRQTWSASAAVLQFIEPVSAAAAPQNAIPSTRDNSNAAIAELDRRRRNADAISKIGTMNANNTINLIRTWNPPRR